MPDRNNGSGFETETDYEKIYEKNKDHPLKILFKLYQGNYGRFFLAILFFVIKHSPVWVLPVVMSNIINIATAPAKHSPDEIVMNALAVIALVALNIPSHYLFTRCLSKATRQVEIKLRSALVVKLQQLSISYHQDTESGRLQSKIIRDVEAIEMLSFQVFSTFLTVMLNIIIALSVTISKSVTVFAFFLLAAPVAGVMVAVFKKSMRKRNTEFRKEMENTSAKVMEMVNLIPVTRAHALEDEEIFKMNRQLSEVSNKGYRLDIIQGNFGAVSWSIFQIFQVICLSFTGFLAFRGQISIGEIALYQSYFTTIVDQVSAFVNMMPNLTRGTESIRSVGEILMADDVENYQGKINLNDVEGKIEFQNVSFEYEKDHPVLSGLNLTVEKGETVALVGESGAGKSTILNLVIGFNQPTGGRILLDGHDMRQINMRTCRKHIAVVFQNTILFSGSIRDNITYGMESCTEKQLEDAILAANLTETINKLPDGVDTVIGERGSKLSGGQRQRLSIARALIRDPKIIILDEATSALDSPTEKKIQSAIDNLVKDRTTFIVAHRLSTIRNADKIAVISDGGCVEYGTYDELMAQKGRFYEMRRLQTQ